MQRQLSQVHVFLNRNKVSPSILQKITPRSGPDKVAREVIADEAPLYGSLVTDSGTASSGKSNTFGHYTFVQS